MSSEISSASRALVRAWDATLDESEIDAAAWTVARAVRETVGRAPGRVGVYAMNSGATLVTYLGVVYSGLSVVPLNTHLNADELPYLIEKAGLDLIICDAVTESRVRALQRAREGIRVLVLGEDLDPLASTGAQSSGLPNEAEERVRPPLMFTSGTSGRPKLVEMPPAQFSGGATIREFRAWAATLRFAGRGAHLVCGPLYHAGPLQAVWLAAAGTPVVVPKKFEAGPLLEIIAEQRIATSLMVPTHLVRFLAAREDGRQGVDVSSLQHVTLTGAMCPPHVKKSIIEWWGPVLYEGYGGTESGGLCYISSQEWLERPTSVGRPTDRFRVVVVDESGEEVPTGVDGALYFEDLSGRGIEYLDDPAATAEVHLRPGVFTLGEIGHVDEEGYVYITDRDSEKIVSGGVNLYPAEIERVLVEHPGVEDVVVIGVRDDEMGENVCALVKRSEEGPLARPDELIAHCVERLSRLKSPRYVHFVEDLPRVTMGKANRRKLREKYEPIILARIAAEKDSEVTIGA